jgi:SAM-dependent methyltransferase
MDRSPKNISLYREEDYWENRYTQSIADKEETHDWLLPYSRIKPLFLEAVAAIGGCHFDGFSSPRILVLGCGNSTLSESLYDEGYTQITNVDYSQTVIDLMRRRNACDRPLMQWLRADFRHMSEVQSGGFDLVIDKGSLDAVFCDGGSLWKPSDRVIKDASMCVDEVLRVLVPGAVFLGISFAQPHFRLPLIGRPDCWSLTATEIPDTFYHRYLGIKSL